MHKYSKGLHHQNIRKRIHQKFEKYPHPNKWKNFLDRAILFIGVLGPIITMPQLLKVWIYEDASGLSLTTWTLWIFIDSIWIIYGYVHKVPPIIISHSAYILVQTGVVIGIIIYG